MSYKFEFSVNPDKTNALKLTSGGLGQNTINLSFEIIKDKLEFRKTKERCERCPNIEPQQPWSPLAVDCPYWEFLLYKDAFVNAESLDKDITADNALKKLQAKIFQSMEEVIRLRDLLDKLVYSRKNLVKTLKKLGIKQLIDVKTIQQRIMTEELVELVSQCNVAEKKLSDIKEGVYKITSMIRRLQRKQEIDRTLQLEEIKELLAYLDDSTVPPIVGNLNLDEVLKKELSE